MLSLFLLWGPLFMTGNGPKKVHFGPKLAKHGRLVNVPKWSKGSKRELRIVVGVMIEFSHR